MGLGRIGQYITGGLGAIRQAKKLLAMLQGSLNAIMDHGISAAAVQEAGEGLKQVATEGHQLLAKLPEGEWRDKMAQGLTMLQNLAPKVGAEKIPTPLKQVVEGTSETSMTEWASALHENLLADDKSLGEQVEGILNILQ